ncbi:hypothetical protein EMN47_13435 [Prolixibacteraceae bacterium JC049]|nr:hypothetical protein [Prolixibacteraceae bacterium JC049]
MIYTISSDLLENIGSDELIYFSDLLMEFSNKSNSYKVTRDHKNLVIDKYTSISNNSEFIKVWLDLMTFTPSSFEKINVDLENIDCAETFFMELCKETIGNKNLVVYSHQNVRKVEVSDNKLVYNGITLNVLDRDMAKNRISNKASTTHVEGDYISHSQVVKDNGKMNKSENK